MTGTRRTSALLSLAAVVGACATILAAGCGLTVFTADVTAGSCEGDAYGKDMSFDTGFESPETTFGTTVDGSDIVIEIDDVAANCCPSPGADITTSGTGIHVDFQDVTADEACGCTCVMDFEIRIPDVGPGDYTIDLDYNGEDLTTLEVSVP